MNIKKRTLTIKTRKPQEFVDITELIKAFIQEHACKNGILTCFVPHTTAAITINENADPDVLHDMSLGFNKIAPNDTLFKHFEGNSDAHIKSTLVSPSLSLIVEEGKLLLGQWQGIYFCEFDGARSRKLMVHFMGF